MDINNNQTVVSPPQKSHSVLLIVLLLLLVGGGSVFFFYNHITWQDVRGFFSGGGELCCSQPPLIVPAEESNTDLNTDGSLNWKTYTDEKVGFTISYPYISKAEPVRYELSGGYTLNFNDDAGKFLSSLRVSQYDAFPNDYDSAVKYIFNCSPEDLCTRTEVDGVEAVDRHFDREAPEEETIAFAKNNAIFYISTNGEKNKDILDKMVASFKFTK